MTLQGGGQGSGYSKEESVRDIRYQMIRTGPVRCVCTLTGVGVEDATTVIPLTAVMTCRNCACAATAHSLCSTGALHLCLT
jgi:hypothetical protein